MDQRQIEALGALVMLVLGWLLKRNPKFDHKAFGFAVNTVLGQAVAAVAAPAPGDGTIPTVANPLFLSDPERTGLAITLAVEGVLNGVKGLIYLFRAIKRKIKKE